MPERLVMDHPEFNRVARAYRTAVKRGDEAGMEKGRAELHRLVIENVEEEARCAAAQRRASGIREEDVYVDELE